MRRPHVGQSFRSFWASWSHQLQKRRFSTAHGSRERDGASGRTLPDDLELLAGVAVAVDAVRLGLEEDHLAPGRRRAQAVAAAEPSARSCSDRAGPARCRPPAMRILIFHGYLLRGTGSNVYNARLAAALRAPGTRSHLLCQERRAARARLRRRRRRLGRRRARASTSCREPVRVHRLPARHRRPAAGLRRRPLRGRRGASRSPTAPTRRSTRYLDAQRRRGARGRRARAARRRARQPPRDGPADPRPRARRRGARTRSRSTAARSSTPSSRDPERFLPVRARGPRARARGPRRLAPHRREPVGGDGRPRRCRRARGSGRRASTSSAFRPRAARRGGGRGWRRSPTRLAGGRRGRGRDYAFARDEAAAAARWRALDPRGATASSRSSAS